MKTRDLRPIQTQTKHLLILAKVSTEQKIKLDFFFFNFVFFLKKKRTIGDTRLLLMLSTSKPCGFESAWSVSKLSTGDVYGQTFKNCCTQARDKEQNQNQLLDGTRLFRPGQSVGSKHIYRQLLYQKDHRLMKVYTWDPFYALVQQSSVHVCFSCLLESL